MQRETTAVEDIFDLQMIRMMLGYWFIIDLIYMQRFGVLLVCIRCRLLPVPAYFLQTMTHSTLQLIGYRDVVM